MEQDYDNWNNLKKLLSKEKSSIFFHKREILYCSLGKNIRHEEDGKNELFERPILIIKKFNTLKDKNPFWGFLGGRSHLRLQSYQKVYNMLSSAQSGIKEYQNLKEKIFPTK